MTINHFRKKAYRSFRLGSKYAFDNRQEENRKYLNQSPFFDKVTGTRPATFLRKRLAQVFSCEIYQIFKSTVFYETPPVATPYFSGAIA